MTLSKIKLRKFVPRFAVALGILLCVACGRFYASVSKAPPTAGASLLSFTIQPSQTSITGVISPGIQVTALNADGSVNTNFAGTIVLSMGNNPTSATLSGTLTSLAASGVAVFTGLSINKISLNYTLQASASGYGSVFSNAFNIISGPPATFTFSGPASVLENGCSTAFTVGLKDSLGNATVAVSSLTVTPSGGTSSVFYSDPTCMSAVPSQVIASGAASATFYATDGTSELTTITVNGGALPAATSTLLVQTQLMVSVAPGGSQPSGTCLTLTFTNVDALLTLKNVIVGATVSPSSTHYNNTLYYSDNVCTVAATNFFFNGGTNTHALYAKTFGGSGSSNYLGGTSYQPMFVSGVNPLIFYGSGFVNVTTVLAPTNIALSGPSATAPNTCSGAFYVKAIDNFSEVSAVGGAQAITLTTSVGTVSYYSDPTCLSLLGAGTAVVNIPLSSTMTSFYVKDTVAENYTITATPASLGGAVTFLGSTNAAIPTVQLAAGGNFTCAAYNGAAKCWGNNSVGQSGSGAASVSPLLAPTTVSGLGANVVQVAAMTTAACALKGDGTVWCWGSNAGGLGDGVHTSSTTPVQVAGLAGVSSIATGGGTSTCAIAAGDLKCWGTNFSSTTPIQVTPASDATVFTTGVTNVSVGESQVCAIVGGAAYCLGYNNNGQLGNGSTSTSWTGTATPVSGMANGVTAISAGGLGGATNSFTCAIRGGALKCWGFNSYGELGDGTTTNRPSPVTTVASGVAQVSMGGVGGCLITVAGTIKCWGLPPVNATFNYILGNGTSAGSSVPVTNDLTSVVNGVSVGVENSGNACAVNSSGNIYCWGATQQSYSSLGDGTISWAYDIFPPLSFN